MTSNNVHGFSNQSKINQEAAEWVLLIEESEKLTDQQIQSLNNWVATSEIHRACLESMARSWGELDLLSEVIYPQEMKRKSHFFVFATILTSATKTFRGVFTPLAVTSAVFSLIVVMLFTVDFEETNSSSMLLLTKVGEQSSYPLPDGSTVWLNSNTEVLVDYSDSQRKINLLSGEAHFEVVNDPSRPFDVFVDNRLIKAIGTAFSVHKIDKSVEVMVTEGAVELAVIDNELVLIPDEITQNKISNGIEAPSESKWDLSDRNNEVVANSKSKVVLKTLVAGQRISIPAQHSEIGDVEKLDSRELTRSLSWKEGKLVFAGESLEEVIQEITRHTEVVIEVADPKLKTIRIGGQFQAGETDLFYYVLESGFGVKVNKLDDQHVRLTSK